MNISSFREKSWSYIYKNNKFEVEWKSSMESVIDRQGFDDQVANRINDFCSRNKTIPYSRVHFVWLFVVPGILLGVLCWLPIIDISCYDNPDGFGPDHENQITNCINKAYVGFVSMIVISSAFIIGMIIYLPCFINVAYKNNHKRFYNGLKNVVNDINNSTPSGINVELRKEKNCFKCDYEMIIRMFQIVGPQGFMYPAQNFPVNYPVNYTQIPYSNMANVYPNVPAQDHPKSEGYANTESFPLPPNSQTQNVNANEKTSKVIYWECCICSPKNNVNGKILSSLVNCPTCSHERCIKCPLS